MSDVELVFGCCARCGAALDVHTGADGDMIVPGGHCSDCDLTTIWQPVGIAPSPLLPNEGE